MLAAARADVEGVVSLAGPARSAAMTLRDQLRPRLPPALWQQSEAILARLECGHTTDAVHPTLLALYRPSVQPYLISWLRYHPAAEAARLRIPMLVAHGTTDLQVPVEEAELLKAAQPLARLALVEGMNHILKLVPADPVAQETSYSNPDLPVAPELIGRIATFISDRHL